MKNSFVSLTHSEPRTQPAFRLPSGDLPVGTRHLIRNGPHGSTVKASGYDLNPLSVLTSREMYLFLETQISALLSGCKLLHS